VDEGIVYRQELSQQQDFQSGTVYPTAPVFLYYQPANFDFDPYAQPPDMVERSTYIQQQQHQYHLMQQQLAFSPSQPLQQQQIAAAPSPAVGYCGHYPQPARYGQPVYLPQPSNSGQTAAPQACSLPYEIGRARPMCLEYVHALKIRSSHLTESPLDKHTGLKWRRLGRAVLVVPSSGLAPYDCLPLEDPARPHQTLFNLGTVVVTIATATAAVS